MLLTTYFPSISGLHVAVMKDQYVDCSASATVVTLPSDRHADARRRVAMRTSPVRAGGARPPAPRGIIRRPSQPGQLGVATPSGEGALVPGRPRRAREHPVQSLQPVALTTLEPSVAAHGAPDGAYRTCVELVPCAGCLGQRSDDVQTSCSLLTWWYDTARPTRRSIAYGHRRVGSWSYPTGARI